MRVYLEGWLNSRKPEFAHATFQRYEKTVEKFIKFLGADAERDLGEISKTRIAQFRDAQAAQTSQANANVDLKVIRIAFRAARLDGFLWQDPAEGVKTFRVGDDSESRRPFSIDELGKVLANADPEWQSLIKFGLYTGQRLADIAFLGWEQIDLERDEIRLVVRKTKKRLVVPIAPALHEHLLSLSAPDQLHAPVHPGAYGIVTSQHGRVGTLSNAFADLLAQAGLRSPRSSASTGRGHGNARKRISGLSFHSLRHTAVSLLKDAGVPDAVVMALVGHESSAMSQRYTHVGKEALAKAASRSRKYESLAAGILNDLQDFPDKVSDPHWLRKLEEQTGGPTPP